MEDFLLSTTGRLLAGLFGPLMFALGVAFIYWRRKRIEKSKRM